MTSDNPQNGRTAHTPEELREQVERTREELGVTVGALAAKADVKTQAQDKAAAVRQQVSARTGQARTRLRETTAHVAQLVQDKTPESVRTKAAAANGQVRDKAAHIGQLARDKAPEPVRDKAGQAARTARENRTLLIAGVGAVAVFLFIRRSRRH